MSAESNEQELQDALAYVEQAVSVCRHATQQEAELAKRQKDVVEVRLQEAAAQQKQVSESESQTHHTSYIYLTPHICSLLLLSFSLSRAQVNKVVSDVISLQNMLASSHNFVTLCDSALADLLSAVQLIVPVASAVQDASLHAQEVIRAEEAQEALEQAELKGTKRAARLKSMAYEDDAQKKLEVEYGQQARLLATQHGFRPRF